MACNNPDRFSIWFTWTTNLLYFIFFFVRAYLLFAFQTSVFRLGKFTHNLIPFLMRIPMYIGIIMSLESVFTGHIFYVTEEAYVQGPLYGVTYIVSWFYIICLVCELFIYKKKIKRKRHKYSIALYDASLITGIICRWYFPQYLLMDTFCLIAVLVMYLALGNPEFYLESRGSVFNNVAFRDYIDEHNGALSNGVLGVIVKNHNEMRDIYGGKQMDEGILSISAYLARTFPDLTAFYYRKGRYILMGPEGMDYVKVSNEIRRRFRDPWTSNDMELYLNVGFIYTDLKGSVESSDVLISTLLTAFSEVDKSAKTECRIISKEDFVSNVNETNVKKYLEKAVEDDDIEVFLQPLIDSNTYEMVGAEALCRIRDDEGNIIPPGVFIPIAEENGKINDLGEQVFRKTCEFISKNDMEMLGISWINVNLSPQQFMKTDLPEIYAEIAKEYNVDPSMVHLEITEEFLSDENLMSNQVKAMQDLGFMFVLDDYGTGYSNVSRLKNIRFVNIKFDMSIVWEYYKDPDVIFPSMVTAFKNMNFGVTAEGIEDKNMADAMKDLGLDYLQGYYFSKPLSMDAFIRKYGAV